MSLSGMMSMRRCGQYLCNFLRLRQAGLFKVEMKTAVCADEFPLRKFRASAQTHYTRINTRRGHLAPIPRFSPFVSSLCAHAGAGRRTNRVYGSEVYRVTNLPVRQLPRWRSRQRSVHHLAKKGRPLAGIRHFINQPIGAHG